MSDTSIAAAMVRSASRALSAVESDLLTVARNLRTPHGMAVMNRFDAQEMLGNALAALESSRGE